MSTSTEEEWGVVDRASSHVGRPREPARADAIRAAVLDLLAEQGYERMSIEAIAARAGAGKATVYRRWASKADLVMDALHDVKPAAGIADTGSLRGDLDQLCAETTDALGHRAIAVMHGLASALPHDPALLAAFNAHFVAPRRAAMAEMFARAVARGEMPPGKDVDLLTSVIPALMIFRLLRGGELPEPAFVRCIVEELLLPAATSGAPTTRPIPEGSPHGR